MRDPVMTSLEADLDAERRPEPSSSAPAEQHRAARSAGRGLATVGRPKGWRRGFTILELLVVMILIAVVASFSISAFFDQSEVSLENAIKLMAEDLHIAQSRATYLQLPVTCVIEEDGDGYSFQDSGQIDAQHSAAYPLPLRRYSVDAVFEGVRISEVQLGGGRRLEFDEKGRALNGGSVTLSYRGDSRRVEIQPGTGRLRLPDVAKRKNWFERFF